MVTLRVNFTLCSFMLLTEWNGVGVVEFFQCHVSRATLSSTLQVAWLHPVPSVRRVLVITTRIGLAWARATAAPVSLMNWIRTCHFPRASVSVRFVVPTCKLIASWQPLLLVHPRPPPFCQLVSLSVYQYQYHPVPAPGSTSTTERCRKFRFVKPVQYNKCN